MSFEANRLKSIETRDSSAVGIRILKGGRVGVSAATGDPELVGLLARALETLPYGPIAAMDLPGAQEYPNVPVYDAATAELPVEAMVELGRELVERMQQKWTDVQWDWPRLPHGRHPTASSTAGAAPRSMRRPPSP